MKRVLSCALSLLIIISSFTGVGMPEHVRAQAVEGSISAVLRLQYWLDSEPVTINGPGEYTFKMDNLDGLNCGLKLFNEAENDGINGIHIEDASPLGADNAQYSLLQYYSVITKSVRINGRECELIPNKQGVTVPKNVAGGREKFSLSYVNAGWMDGTGIEIPEPISDGEKLSSVEIVIEVSDYMQPNIELPTAPEGYEIAYMHDMRDIDLTPNWQETHTNDASNAAIAEALKKDGAYIEFIGAYPRANSGWIQFELSDNTNFSYATYDNSEIKPTVRTENENSILTVGNDVVADALKRAEEKGVTITGVNHVSLNYNNSDGSTDEEEARKSKCVCLVVYSELPLSSGEVYTSENGATPNTSKDAYGFFVVGGNVWGQDTCCGISTEKMREYFRDGGYNLSFVFGGTPGNSAPVAVINGEFEGGVEMTVKELGDGRHEATIPLQAVLEGYGKTADEVDGLCVQTWVENFALYEIRLYKSGAEPEPEPEVELNVYWYPAQHDNTSTWDNTYYEGFTGDEYYDVFGKETAVVTDVSTKWDIADDNWQYLWLGIEDKRHNPGHNFTVKISGIVFHTDGNDVTYSGIDGERTIGSSGIIPVKVSDVCGEQDTAEFLKSLETITVTLICTEHNGNKAVFDPTFASKSLVLSDQIGVNFFMNLGGLTEAERQSSYMTFTVNGNERRVNYDGSFRDETSGNYYGFTCPINSIQMADTITAVFHYGDGKTVSTTYSVKDYVDYISGQSGFSQETVALVNALADLGHYVQPVLAETNGWNLGSDHAIMESKSTYGPETVEAVKTAAAEYKYEIERPTGAIITNLTYSLDLETKTSIKIYVEVAEGSEVSATVNGSAANCSLLSDGRYCIVIGDISAHKLGDKYNVTITAGSETATITNLSALSYVNTVLSSDNVSNEESYAVASIYNYYVAAEKYISAKGE